MKKPDIKSFTIHDALKDRLIHGCNETWAPENPEIFDFWMELTIGVKGKKGGDNFNVHVISQKALNKAEPIQHSLIVPHFESVAAVIQSIEKSIEDCTGHDWTEIARKIASKYAWEFIHHQ